jgi:Spy/CpxP family protein refolding chaperone
MKTLLYLTLGALLACSTFASAQTSTNVSPSGPPPDGGGGGGGNGGGWQHHGMNFLTDAEKAELKKAHDAAIAADPSLATQEEANRQAMEAAHESDTPPTDDQKAQWHAFRDKMDAAMVKADPAVAPILAKIKAHHHGPGGPGGGAPPPPPDSGT